MSGFSADWLALREPADHRSRATDVAERVRSACAARSSLSIVDIGCGTGSNLRATSALLPDDQRWTLVDYDPALLAAARDTLAIWADRSEPVGEGIRLWKGSRRIEVTFRQADLNADLDAALNGPANAAPDLVTASAFFDLCSPAFMLRFARSLRRLNAMFYTVLTYNGEQGWTPAHPSDAAMTEAFHRHQCSDKGFGDAAGPESATMLAAALREAGYGVVEGDSPWILGASEQRLVSDLAAGFADAVAETGRVRAEIVAAWKRVVRTGAHVGHTDTFAQPS